MYTLTIAPARSGMSELRISGIPDSGPIPPSLQLSIMATAGQSVTFNLTLAPAGMPVVLRAGGFAGAEQDIKAGVSLGLVSAGMGTSLYVRLEAAERAVAAERLDVALALLRSAMETIRAQTGRGITSKASQVLREDVLSLQQTMTP
jgi:hypothetical protein